MEGIQPNEIYIEPIYAWAFSENLEIPSNVAPETRELRRRLDRCNLNPRDPATYERHVLRLMKAVYLLRWFYEKPNQLQGDRKRITRLTNLQRNLKELDMFDDLHLSAYLNSSAIIKRLKVACKLERKRLSQPFQLEILHVVAEIYPFLTSYTLSLSKGSKFMELAGEIDGYITGRELADPAASMADYAKNYGFNIEKYKRLEEILKED